jgi:CheY-like chemotaxis protein
LVRELGFQCLIAETADEGALLARQYLPHAVILDMNLPDHTGLSVLDRIKRDTRTRHIPVHVVSVEGDTQAALASGAVGYLFKPVTRNALVEMLEGLEHRMSQRMRRVLVVEDDATQAESIRHLLASRDVETVEVHNAAQCLDLLARQAIDFATVDVSLRDGWCDELVEELTARSIPFVYVSGYNPGDRRELRSAAWVRKPVVEEELLCAVQAARPATTFRRGAGDDDFSPAL